MTLPKSPLGQRLCEIFAYRWKWINASLEDSAIVQKWETNDKYPLKSRTLWKHWQDANTVVGVRFGNSTKYALIDIDHGSPYIEHIDGIKGALETIGITRTITLRSSWSGGLHIYIPLPQAFPTFSVACALKACLEAQGYPLRQGELETFPNVKAYARKWLGEFTEYNGHRLPLQPATGSTILDADLTPHPYGESLSHFFAMWDNCVLLNDRDEIAEALSIARANMSRKRARKATGPAEQWRKDLEDIIAEGWTGPGQTNQLLKEIACFGRVFERLSGDALVEYVQRIATSRPGFERWCQHAHEIDRRAKQWALAAQGFYWPLGDPPLRDRTLQSVNKNRSLEARERIAAAMRMIRFEGITKVGELAKRLVKAASCSLQTLYRHLDLWHPNQSGVTPCPEGDTDDIETVRRLVRESLESAENRAVTRNGGENEVCNLKSSDLKNLSSREERGGAGEREGLSTGQQSTGWLPPLDWAEGAVHEI